MRAGCGLGGVPGIATTVLLSKLPSSSDVLPLCRLLVVLAAVMLEPFACGSAAAGAPAAAAAWPLLSHRFRVGCRLSGAGGALGSFAAVPRRL